MMTFEIEAGGRIRHVTVTRTGAGFAITVDGRAWNVDARRIDTYALSLLLGRGEGSGKAERVSKEVIVVGGTGQGQVTVYVDDTPVPVSMNGHGRWSRGAESGHAGDSGPLRVIAPMPGKV